MNTMSCHFSTCAINPAESSFFPNGSSNTFAADGMLHPRIETPRMNLAHLASRVSRGPLDVLLRHRIRVRIARLADVVEENLHFRNARMRSTASIRFSNELAMENRK